MSLIENGQADTLILSSQICYGMGKTDHRNQEAKYNGPGSLCNLNSVSIEIPY